MISIIGAGPAGNYLAALLAKQGEEVCVYEEHKKIGEPVQCAGIVISDLDKFVDVEKFLVNKVKKFRVFLNDNYEIFEVKKPNYVIDRKKFDKYLAKKAMDYGAEYKLGWKFLGFDGKKLKFNKGFRETNILVGADGPFSMVAKKAGLYGNRKFMVAAQTTCRKKVDKDVSEGHIGKEYFGWIIPENSGRVRVGIAAGDNIGYYFKKFLDKFDIKARNFQSGFVPIYNPRAKICRGNVYLVGDAAGQVKATSCGGILQGLMAAQELCKAILYGYDYEKLCKKRFGLDLYASLLVRRRLNKLKRKDFEYLYKLVKQDRIKEILNKYDRDYAWKILFNVGIREPRFLRFLF